MSYLVKRLAARRIESGARVTSRLEEQRVAGALVRGLLNALDVGHRQVVPDRLHLVRYAARVLDPPGPVVLTSQR